MNNQEAEWLKDLKNELGNDKYLQERVVVSVEKVIRKLQESSRKGWRSRLLD